MMEIKIDCRPLNEQIAILSALLEMQTEVVQNAADGAICVLSEICYALENNKEIIIMKAEDK